MNELIEAEIAEYRNGAYADHSSAKDQLTRFYELAYQAGAEKGKEAYERDIKAIQDQVAEACAKVCDAAEEGYAERESRRWSEMRTDAQQGVREVSVDIRSGEWQKYLEGK